ncbi:MAG: hypothetical protein QM674_00045 [Burkholderiaceae bacterium]
MTQPTNPIAISAARILDCRAAWFAISTVGSVRRAVQNRAQAALATEMMAGKTIVVAKGACPKKTAATAHVPVINMTYIIGICCVKARYCASAR